MHRRLVEKVNTKGKLIVDGTDIYTQIKNLDIDHYISVYKYNEDQKSKFYSKVEKINDKGEKYPTINGAEAIFDVTTTQLVFDFDSKEDLDQAKKDTIEAVNRLTNNSIPEDAIQVYFSGSKGFGINIEIDEPITPEVHKNIAKNLVGDLKTWDSKIYNASRVLRVPLTKHPDTGLYKISLQHDELKHDIDVILDWAKEKYNPSEDLPEYKTSHLPESLKLLSYKKEEKKEKVSFDGENHEIDWSEKPAYLSNWKFALSRGYFPPGSRNHALMILAATYRGLKKNRTETYYLLKSAADLQSKLTGQDKYDKKEIWGNIINTVYSPGWQGGTYAEDNFPEEIIDYFEELQIPREEVVEKDLLIENVKDGFNSFVNYAKRIDEYTMTFGIPSLDNKLKCRKGHLIYMLAPPGVGKTSFAITLLNNMSKQGTGCYFGSYDMYKNNVYQKLIQRHTGLSEEELYEIFINDDASKISELRQLLVDEYKNVSFCYRVGQSIQDLKFSIDREEKRLGKPIELVVVDYLELVLTDAKDPTAASAEAAQGLREIANDGRVVFGLLQPNKFSSTPDEAITSYNAAKGSSSIAQSATAMITGHRPGMSSENNNENDEYFSINCVKNRNGGLFSLDFGWEGSTQTIYELDDLQQRELKDLREKKKAAKLADLEII